MTAPAEVQEFLDRNQYRMDLPAQFFGDEPNSRQKPWDPATVRWCLCASWPYEDAAGNQSIPAVYKAINDGSDAFLCDRFYLPATPRDMRMLEKSRIPVFGIESKHELLDFDVVATSISYPVLMMSFHKMLRMSGIPVRWKDRASDPGAYPMVVVGGQVYGAPESLAPIVDCVWLGEVEDEPGNSGISQVCSRIEMFKEEGRWASDRISCYEQLAMEFNYLYFPRFVDVGYGYEDRSHVEVGLTEGAGPTLSKHVTSWTTNLEGMRAPFLKRIVKDMNAVVPLDDPPLLYTDPSMGAGDIEAGRGCPAWCSFCALTYRQKPYRQRSVPYMIEYAKKFQRNVGGVELSPFSPDFPMHTQRKALIAGLLEQVCDEADSVAMRVDDFIADEGYILLQVAGGMDAVTLGLEGNSQRMRDLVGKGTADADVHEAVTRGIRAGLRKFKFFMISNLPGEDEGDIFRILQLARDLAAIRDSMGRPGVRIQFSWTPLLIESGTPFQWFAPTTGGRTLGDVWEIFRDLKIDFKLGSKSEPNRASFFQLCQRASRDVGEAIVDTLDGINQACWGGVPKTLRDALEANLIKHGFLNGFEDCFDERFKNDMFGTEFIDQGISVELLWRTYLQMREFVEQTDSFTYDRNFEGMETYHGSEWIPRCDTNCQGKSCGVCDFRDLRIRTGYIRAAQEERHVDLSSIQPVDQSSMVIKVRARIHKPEEYRLVTNDHWRYSFRRAAYRAAWRMHGGDGFSITKRSIRFASDTIAYKDWTCGIDYVEFGLTKNLPADKLQEFIGLMNEELVSPRGTRWLEIQEWRFYPAAFHSMRTDVDLSLFRLEIDAPADQVRAKIQLWDRAEHIKMMLKLESSYYAAGAQEVNAKDYVRDFWLTRDGSRLFLNMLIRGRPSPYNIYAALMGRASWIDAAANPAIRIDSFVEVSEAQGDFLRPSCEECGILIPVNILDEPFHPRWCPRHLAAIDGSLVPELATL